MAKTLLKFIALGSVLVGLASCTAASHMLPVLRGNLAYSRGDYQAALVHYLSTPERAESRGWLMFNIGNVYYALGEHDAALASWSDAMLAVGGPGDPNDTTLVHASAFNRGVLFYERGHFQDALDEFRYSLEVNSRSVAAKINVELALQKQRSAEQVRQTGQREPGQAEPGGEDPQTVRILEYVRRKEAQRWFANRDADQAHDAQDW